MLKHHLNQALFMKCDKNQTFMGKNLTNSVNKINFLGRDRAHIRLIPENNLQQNGSKK